jgi:hypothetical protein
MLQEDSFIAQFILYTLVSTFVLGQRETTTLWAKPLTRLLQPHT